MPLEMTVAELKEKVKTLQVTAPGQPEEFYAFAASIADRMTDKVTAETFSQAARKVLDECVDDSFNRPQYIVAYFFNRAQMACAALDLMVPQLAEKLCPAELAAEIKKGHQPSPMSTVLSGMMRMAR